MRFERIRIHAYGGLRDLDTGPGPLPGLVVVEGPNEAGKSTFFSFLTCLLYGFYPAKRETNPYAPWDGTEPSGFAHLVLGDGRRIEIHRRLQSTPVARLVDGDREEELRNRNVPAVEHVPLTVFEQVFALTLADLAALEGESWARVQDRLVTGMGTSDLHPPREIADALEGEAGSLWRPNQRGNQVVRDLEERSRQLLQDRRVASETDRELRDDARRLEEARARIAEAREERIACELYVERHGALLRLKDRLDRIRHLQEEAGDASDLEELPGDPAGRLEELAARRGEIEERLAGLRGRIDEARVRIEAFDADQRALAGARDRIRGLAGRVSALEPLRTRQAGIEREIGDLGRRVDDIVEALTETSGDDAEAFRRVAVPRLREAVAELVRARESLRVAEAATIRTTDPPASRSAVPGGVIGAVGGGLVVVGGVVPSTALLVAGVVVLVFGAVLLGRALGPAGAARADRSTGVDEARAAESAAAREVEAALAGVKLQREALEHGVSELPTRVERLQELMRDVDARRAESASLEGRIDSVHADVRVEGEERGIDLPGEVTAAGYVLEERVREAVALQQAAASAEAEVERLRGEAERVGATLAQVEEEEERLRGRLADLGEGDPERGLPAARRRLEARDAARRLLDELEREHPDLDEIRERIRKAEEDGEEWTRDDEALAKRRAREKELDAEIEDLRGTIERLETSLEHRSGERTAAEIEGELAATRQRIDEAVRRRDRLYVLAAILRQADRTFREEHQPDVLRRASERLETITGGRYDRLLVSESAGDATFSLRGPGAPDRPLPVDEPVSTGTREQVYLAMRLAVLDHLDRGGERLPLFLDEALVNWDESRRDRALRLLSELSGERQLFVFTCHRDVAADLEGRGARRITLAAP